MESNSSLINLIRELIYIFQYGAMFNKMTFSNINLSKKVLLIVVLLFLKVMIRKTLRCNIVSSEDLLKLNDQCHLIRKFSNFSQFYLFLSIYLAFLYYTASFILVIVNVFSVHNDFHANNNFIRFLNFTYSFVEVDFDVSYNGNSNLSELMNKSKPGSNGSNKSAILIFLFLTISFFHSLIKQKPDV